MKMLVIFVNGFAGIELNDKWGYIDEAGKEICEIKYEDIGYFCNGFGQVQLNNKWGFIDETGKEVIKM